MRLRHSSQCRRVLSGFSDMRNVIGVARREDACGKETEEARDNEEVGGGYRAAELAWVVDTRRTDSRALEGTKAQPNREARIASWDDFWVGAAPSCSSSTVDEVSESDEMYNEAVEQRALTCDCVCIKSHYQDRY